MDSTVCSITELENCSLSISKCGGSISLILEASFLSSCSVIPRYSGSFSSSSSYDESSESSPPFFFLSFLVVKVSNSPSVGPPAVLVTDLLGWGVGVLITLWEPTCYLTVVLCSSTAAANLGELSSLSRLSWKAALLSSSLPKESWRVSWRGAGVGFVGFTLYCVVSAFLVTSRVVVVVSKLDCYTTTFLCWLTTTLVSGA